MRLLLVRHAPTAATERVAFAADEPITVAGRSGARALAAHLPATTTAVSSPLLRARQTAEAAGRHPELDARLAECRFGAWEGRTFAELGRDDPQRLDAWLRDPEASPPGGESLSGFAARVAAWLGDVGAGTTGTTVAFTHAGVVKAAVLTALAASLATFWQLAVAPLSITELARHDTGWTVVRLNWMAAG
jgi:broad specificity phosphatase PhoE